MLAAYLSNHDVKLTVPFVDESGNAFTAESAKYRVLDQFENELVPLTDVPDFEDGGAEATLTIPGAANKLSPTITLPNGEEVASTRELRLVEVFAVVEGGTVRFESAYIIEAEHVLIEGVNSFQGYTSALFRGHNIPQLHSWNEASKRDRINALIRAKENISRLRFHCVSKRLNELTSHEYETLNPHLKEALRNAQVIEADNLLGGDEITTMIEKGVISITVGEAKQFFRETRQVQGIVGNRAMRELAAWTLKDLNIGRA
jgi:hypothetical protein